MDPAARHEAQAVTTAERHLQVDIAARKSTRRALSPSDAIDTASRMLSDGGTVVITALIERGRRNLQASVRLAEIATAALQQAPPETAVVILGGETAHATLTRLANQGDESAVLAVTDQFHVGAVALRGSSRRDIVLRPGSFTDGTSLSLILDHLNRPATNPAQVNESETPLPVASETQTTPLIAVSMGDGAGIGPEICLRAILELSSDSSLRPFVIGDISRLRKAARVCGLEPTFVPISSPEEFDIGLGRVHVVDLDLLPESLSWGQISGAAGEAAYQYIKHAAELAVSERIDAICTAPINKKALHLGGHAYPGHTELLAELCGVDEVSMLLSTPKVNVVHVTTHIGLIDAIDKIEPGLVERTTRRGHDAMVQAGIVCPRIAVCAINPHAGENGLFGYGEEESKIVPAISRMQSDGLAVEGPLSADTAFFLASRGDYDLVVAMYHDQGHGPVKVLGIDAGVNVTVGLPVIRTSVDHGTAFDIAGRGVADPASMVEAIRQAATMSRGRREISHRRREPSAARE
ncbi:4-hydroxythreonine-4-phosphate dehydrogenase PdxA [Georgenia halophila]